MSHQDITRWLFDSRKRYTRNHMQAGRIITDADWNSNIDAATDDTRRTILDVVGAYGSPDTGFRVANPQIIGDQIDFELLPGTLFLGGLRLRLDAISTYRTQTDDVLLERISAPRTNRNDLVLIEAYEAPVSAVEDNELLDPALGGADTTQHLLRYQRVLVVPDIGASNCAEAFQNIKDMLLSNNSGTIDPTYQQITDARLTVTYTDEGVDDDLCEPPFEGGYLGAENTAIRVQIVDDSHLTWGYDNASPLYRVNADADDVTLTMITMPRDQYSTPQDGQIIEILPWHAVLNNNEKTAALSGHLTRIATVNTNDDGQISLTLTDPLPSTDYSRWQNRPDAEALADAGTHYYMRIWNRGADIGSAPAINFSTGSPITLGTTGIEITLYGDHFIRDDYWVIAARPQTPTQVLPWALEEGIAPHGMQRFIAPLALIQWDVDNEDIRIDDCRPRFRSLVDLNGCCTYTVGDGIHSQGEFNSLSVALDALPADGGQICLLPGLHRADVRLLNRRNVIISGCGLRSKVIPDNGQDVFTIVNCFNVELRDVNIVTVAGSGVVARQTSNLRLSNVNVLASIIGIDADDIDQLTISNCVVRILDKDESGVGIYAQGDDLTVHDCHVQVVPQSIVPEPPPSTDPDRPPINPTDPCADAEKFYANMPYLVFYAEAIWTTLSAMPEARLENDYLATGGIQIGSGSEDVHLHHNTVIGGAGNGITLGNDLATVLDSLKDETPQEGTINVVSFDHNTESIRGLVTYDNQPAGSMTIFFDNGRDSAINFAVDGSGAFGGALDPDTYQVYVSNSTLQVVDIEQVRDGMYRITLGDAPAGQRNPLLDLIAFIYDVNIADNTIKYMSMNGVGVPTIDTDTVGQMQNIKGGAGLRAAQQSVLLVYLLTGTITGFVVNLVIERNTILRCARNVVLPDSISYLFDRGIGGISLALTDGLIINENTIENCGRGVELPVCGIYGSLTIDMTIKDNHILNNGHAVLARDIDTVIPNDPTSVVGDFASAPTYGAREQPNAYKEYKGNYVTTDAIRLNSTEFTALRDGPRGAIVMPICLSANAFAGVTSSLQTSEDTLMTSFATGRHAARIEGNYVVQPIGKTIFLGALGSVGIIDNQLTSDMALPREQDVRAAGLVGALLNNFKLGEVDLFPSNVFVLNFATGAYMIDLLSSVPLDNFPVERFEGTIPLGFPDGNVLFNSNQVKQGNALNRATNITLFSLDDISMSNNQIDIFNGSEITSTTVLFAPTIRASNNRLKEPVRGFYEMASESSTKTLRHYSIVSMTSLANHLINNQGHYCFLPLSTDRGEVTEFANYTALNEVLNCSREQGANASQILGIAFLLLATLSANFSLGLSRQDDD